jgi:SAM-dependent methyltransferase
MGMADTDDTIYNDFYARRYDVLFHDTPEGRARFEFETGEIRRRMHELGTGERPRILDLGCGTGRHCARLSALAETTGVDSSASMLQVARAACPRTTFIQGDMRDSSLFADEAFTYVLSLYGAIHYSRELDRILRNIASWLRPGGRACLGILDRTRLSPEVTSGSRLIEDQAVTSFPAFEYRSRWERAAGDRVFYHETFVLPWLETVERRHAFHMPRIEALVQSAAAAGLREIDRVSMEPVGCEDEVLLFLDKAPGGQSK